MRAMAYGDRTRCRLRRRTSRPLSTRTTPSSAFRCEQLPIPDYDHLPIGSLSHRIRALDAEGVAAILLYERAHADRVQLVEVLARRLDALRSGETEPSTVDPAAAQPEHAPPAEGSSTVPTTSTTDNNQPLDCSRRS
jgi:hypothetical protein